MFKILRSNMKNMRVRGTVCSVGFVLVCVTVKCCCRSFAKCSSIELYSSLWVETAQKQRVFLCVAMRNHTIKG